MTSCAIHVQLRALRVGHSGEEKKIQSKHTEHLMISFRVDVNPLYF